MSAGRRLGLAAALVLLSGLAIAALYGRALDYPLVWMDEREIGEGEIVLAPGEPWSAAFTRPLHRAEPGQASANPYYRPLQILAATGVHRVAGTTPRAYRALSLALAIGACAAFGALAFALFGRPAPALAAAALAAVHPAGIEAWLWISGLGDALSVLLAMASLALGAAALRGAGGPALAAGAAAVLAFLLALLAKEKAIVVPALLAGVAATLAASGERGGSRAALRRGGALVAALSVLAVAYVLVWRPLMLGSAALAASPIGGDRVTHLLSAVASWPASLGWLLAPLRSTTSDVVRVVTTPLDPAFLLGVGLALGSAAAAVALWRRGRPVAALGLAWIWLAFLPTANLFPQIHARADRYLFLSVFGLALLLVDLARGLAARAPGRAAPALVAAGLAVLALGWAQRTWARTPDWRSTLALFARDVAGDPEFREGRLHLTRALYAEQRHAEADEHLRALRTAPPDARTHWSYVNPVGARELACHNDLALGRAAQIRAEQAALARTQPELAAQPGLRACRAQAEEALGDLEAALATYIELVATLPEAAPPTVSLAMARLHARLGQPEAARKRLDEARENAPRDPAFDWQVREVERLVRGSGVR